MHTPDEIAAIMAGIRDQVLVAIEEHEVSDHDGRPCWSNRASTVAYLAHCLGIHGQSDLLMVAHHVGEYQRRCTSSACPHNVPEETRALIEEEPR